MPSKRKRLDSDLSTVGEDLPESGENKEKSNKQSLDQSKKFKSITNDGGSPDDGNGGGGQESSPVDSVATLKHSTETVESLSPPNSTVIAPEPSVTDAFKSPHTPSTSNDLASTTSSSSGIRRKSNRISLKRSLNQTNHHGSEEQMVFDSSSIDSGNKPNQSSDVSSTLNSTTSSVVPTTSGTGTKNSPTAASGKSLRKIQAWTEDDIRWFFEALCEHGKDFPHIQSYIASRCEKKGIPQESIKNYEQVRHFYYRMWHKISQILKMAPEVDKAIQEIYGLINYGEIWKKFGSKFECKLSYYLQQLVDYGYIVVKVKGKSVRVRTPVCNALKKIHNISNKISTSKPVTQPMPKEIAIELIPAANSDWLRVHSLAQNPRLRTKLTMQNRLSTLIAYLEKRWDLSRAYHKQLSSTVINGNDGDNTTTSTDDNSKYFRLRLRPPESAKLCDRVTLKSTANSISYQNFRSTTHGTTQIDLSLSAYMKNMFNDSPTGSKKSKIRKSSSKKANNQPDQPEVSGAKSKDDGVQENAKESIEQPEQPVDLFKLLDSMNEALEINVVPKTAEKTPYSEWKSPSTSIKSEPSSSGIAEPIPAEEDESNKLPEPPAHQTLAQWLAGDLDNEHDVAVDDDENKQINDGDETEENLDEAKNDKTADSVNKSSPPGTNPSGKKRRVSADLVAETAEMLSSEKARAGWTLEEARNITIGELYLLFCQPNKIVLEYSWAVSPKQKPEPDPETIATGETEKPLSTLQKFLVAAKMSLMSQKKSGNNNQPSSQTGQNAHAGTSFSGNRTRRRASKNAANTAGQNSQLLSNLIQETILNDTVEKIPEEKPSEKNSPAHGCKGKQPTTVTNSKSNDEKPTTAAVPATSKEPNKAKSRATTVLDDPTKVEEVLKELKVQGRQRRPLTKLMYNSNKILNLNSPRQTVLLITRASNIQGEGSTPKQIVLRASNVSAANHPTSIALTTCQDGDQPTNDSSHAGAALIPVQSETVCNDSLAQTFCASPTTKELALSLATAPDHAQFMVKSNVVDPWLSDVNHDISLGSLFCDKNNPDEAMMATNQRLAVESNPALSLTPLPTDFETHMNTFANDNSVDLMAKFADLAEQIVSSDAKTTI